MTRPEPSLAGSLNFVLHGASRNRANACNSGRLIFEAIKGHKDHKEYTMGTRYEYRGGLSGPYCPSCNKGLPAVRVPLLDQAG
jgi:hypothetical protein